MQQLVIAIVVMAVLSAMSFTTFNYTGDTITANTADATALSVLNQGLQIQQMNTYAVAKEMGVNLTDGDPIQPLVDLGLLKINPTVDGASWTVQVDVDGTKFATIPVTDGVCQSVVASSGSIQVLNSAVAEVGTPITKGVGCIDDGGSPTVYTAFYAL